MIKLLLLAMLSINSWQAYSQVKIKQWKAPLSYFKVLSENFSAPELTPYIAVFKKGHMVFHGNYDHKSSITNQINDKVNNHQNIKLDSFLKNLQFSQAEIQQITNRSKHKNIIFSFEYVSSETCEFCLKRQQQLQNTLGQFEVLQIEIDPQIISLRPVAGAEFE